MRWILAVVHLLALGIGLGAIWARAVALRGPLDTPGVRRVLYADTWWGIAAILWIATGLTRLFGGWEKGTLYYTHNHYFWVKMGMLVSILVLEIMPMITLIKWRARVARNDAVDARNASSFAATSFVQAGLIVLMVLAATAMARGYGVTN